MNSIYSDCTLCPNLCHVDRVSGHRGVCGQTAEIKIAWAGLHRGEEPPVTGKNGSGMIFFCGCPLHCQYCQNYQISTANGAGYIISTEELKDIMLRLQKKGAATLNLVTGTHYIPSIIEALEKAKQEGFSLPVVWNSSGFELVDALRMIDPYIDLYLIDVKTLDRGTASRFCRTADYADVIVPAMSFLKRRHPVSDVENLKGVLVRHLVFPGEMDSTLNFLKWYRDNLKDCSRLSLMVQFVPPKEDPGFEKLSRKDYQYLLKILDEYNIDGYVQEQSDNEILWIPDFNKPNPFPEPFATPL